MTTTLLCTCPPAPFPTDLLCSLTRRSKFLVSTYLLSTTSTGRKNFLTVIREDFYGKLLPRSQEDTLGVTLTTDHLSNYYFYSSWILGQVHSYKLKTCSFHHENQLLQKFNDIYTWVLKYIFQPLTSWRLSEAISFSMV